MPSEPQPVSRRTFLRRAGAVAVSTALGPIVLESFTPLGHAAAAAPVLGSSGALPAGTPIVVVIDLQGGNDFLNTVCPIGDPWYYDKNGRGSLAISQSSALALGGTPFGLHPSLAWLQKRWQSVGDVAIVLGVGENEAHEFSHFKAMDQRNTGVVTGSSATGWLGRYNDIVAPDSPLAAVSTSGLHPSLLASTVPILQVTSCADTSMGADWRWRDGYVEALKAMAANNKGTGMVARSGANHRNVLAAVDRVSAAANARWQTGSSGGVENQLAQCAMLIANGLPSQTYVVSTSGYDTHGSESWMHGDLLKNLDAALKAFFGIVDTLGRRNDVFVLITSEFGRQVRPNASSGTDHGQGGGCIVLGGGVRGGLYGEQPTLNPGGPTAPNRINDALVPTVDFRSVYAGILDRLSGFDGTTATRVLGAPYAPVSCWGAARPAAGGGTTTTTTAPATSSTRR
jgi:uncharacterized protein (DUF1501 family)